MPYRSEKEAWVRRAEEAESRATAAESSLNELAHMGAQTPWKLALGGMVLLGLGIVAGLWMAPPTHKPGYFAALSTQALAVRSRSVLVWNATPRRGTALAEAGETCTLSVDTMDNDGSYGRSVREVQVRVECSGGFEYETLDFAYGERRIGGCAANVGDEPALFCTIEGHSRTEDVALFVNTRRGTLNILKDNVMATFDLEHISAVNAPPPPPRDPERGISVLDTAGTITHVSGIPSEGTLSRPRLRVGAECLVHVESSNVGARHDQCEVAIMCAGTRFEAKGPCTLDAEGQIERVVDLVPSDGAGERGDGNALVLLDAGHRQLVLMERDGHEAFGLDISLESGRSRARYL